MRVLARVHGLLWMRKFCWAHCRRNAVDQRRDVCPANRPAAPFAFPKAVSPCRAAKRDRERGDAVCNGGRRSRTLWPLGFGQHDHAVAIDCGRKHGDRSRRIKIHVAAEGSHFFTVEVEDAPWLLEAVNAAEGTEVLSLVNTHAAAFHAKLVVSHQAIVVAATSPPPSAVISTPVVGIIKKRRAGNSTSAG